MAVQAETKQKSSQQDLEHGKEQDVPVTSPSEWKEDSLSYLTHVQVLLAGLTEADKDAVHASLEEE